VRSPVRAVRHLRKAIPPTADSLPWIKVNNGKFPALVERLHKALAETKEVLPVGTNSLHQKTMIETIRIR
jgi:hypothetical protein